MTNFNESKLSKIIARRIVAPEDRSQLLPFSTPIYCPDNNGVKAHRVTIFNPNANTFYTDAETPNDVSIGSNNVSNTIDIDLTKVVRVNYSVPLEVELKTDVNLMDMIKSDFGVQFKKAVSNEILAQIKQLVATNAVTTFNMGDNLPSALGKAIADNIANGTGQKFSIYKYDNGAPVEYMISSAQPNIDDMVINKEDGDDLVKDAPMNIKSEYALKDDVAVPALYYCEKPTLIFPETTFTDFTTGRVNGSIKDYADAHMNIDTAKVDFTGIGEGIFGTNDTFAVAFTQPSIKEAPDKSKFAKDICVEVYFGVKLIHNTNLKVFI